MLPSDTLADLLATLPRLDEVMASVPKNPPSPDVGEWNRWRNSADAVQEYFGRVPHTLNALELRDALALSYQTVIASICLYKQMREYVNRIGIRQKKGGRSE